MGDDPIFGESKPSRIAALLARFLSRHRGRARTVHRRERLDLLVRSDQSDAVRDAVEKWLVGKGVTAELSIEEAGNSRCRVRAKLSEIDSAKLDLSAEAVQSELEDVIADAMS